MNEVRDDSNQVDSSKAHHFRVTIKGSSDSFAIAARYEVYPSPTLSPPPPLHFNPIVHTVA